MNTQYSYRVASIDVLRAITMVLMIFVNDLWSLRDIPQWLGHVDRGVDGMGLADVILPAFLFIVGMSLPFAIDNRIKKGDSTGNLLLHIVIRTIALLIMGVFLVNGETINAKAMGVPRWLWNPLCCISFILIWNNYPRKLNRVFVYLLKGIGILTLIYLAYIYRGGHADRLTVFGPQWWGILGIIGWSYFASALVVVFSKKNIYWIVAAWVFFALLSVVYKSHLIPQGTILSYIPSPILGGTMTGFTMGGVLASVVFQYYRGRKENVRMIGAFLTSALVLGILTLITRPYWGISKLGETPAWLFACSGITLLCFLIIYWLADVKGKAHWFNFIKPAGTDTLLCYLIPYLLYAFFQIIGFRFPPEVLIGFIGLSKSFLLALLCVLITRGLNQAGVRLKL